MVRIAFLRSSSSWNKLRSSSVRTLRQLARFAGTSPCAGVVFFAGELAQTVRSSCRDHASGHPPTTFRSSVRAWSALRFTRSIPKSGLRSLAFQLGDAGAARIRVKETPGGRQSASPALREACGSLRSWSLRSLRSWAESIREGFGCPARVRAASRPRALRDPRWSVIAQNKSARRSFSSSVACAAILRDASPRPIPRAPSRARQQDAVRLRPPMHPEDTDAGLDEQGRIHDPFRQSLRRASDRSLPRPSRALEGAPAAPARGAGTGSRNTISAVSRAARRRSHRARPRRTLRRSPAQRAAP